MLDDLCLGHIDQGRAEADTAPLHAGAGGEIGEGLEGGDIFRTAVGITGVVHRVDTDIDAQASRTSAHPRANARNTVLRAGT